MLKIGTDCSGIEAPIQALKRLKVPFKHLFSSEKDKYAIQSILANYKPETLYTDMTEKRELPKLDMYVCGFPCQPFSIGGFRKGSKDCRGNIFLNCIETIQQTNPTLFILENVKGILSVEGGSYWKNIQTDLKNLTDYNIYWKVLNTRDYGIPQNRERVYMVGFLKEKQKREFEFPKKIKMKKIERFVDYKITKKDKINRKAESMEKIKKSKGVFIDLGYLKYTNYNSNMLYSACLNIRNDVWCIPMKRRATIKELLSLQAFPKNFKQIVSDSQMKKQIGNSMSVNVLVHLFKSCFDSLKT